MGSSRPRRPRWWRRPSSPSWRGRNDSPAWSDTALRATRVVPREAPPELITRVAVAMALVFLAFTGIAFRLWYLQVVRGNEMRSLSENNRIRLVRVPAGRGIVFDRRGEILIDNRPSFDVV